MVLATHAAAQHAGLRPGKPRTKGAGSPAGPHRLQRTPRGPDGQTMERRMLCMHGARGHQASDCAARQNGADVAQVDEHVCVFGRALLEVLGGG
jgi:hypothetical protein